MSSIGTMFWSVTCSTMPVTLIATTHMAVSIITYPGRPLVKPAKIAGASIEQLLENLKLPEYRSRYRTRRELRGRQAADVLPALKKWVANLDSKDSRYEHHVLEALWVTWGSNKVDSALLTLVS